MANAIDNEGNNALYRIAWHVGWEKNKLLRHVLSQNQSTIHSFSDSTGLKLSAEEFAAAIRSFIVSSENQHSLSVLGGIADTTRLLLQSAKEASLLEEVLERLFSDASHLSHSSLIQQLFQESPAEAIAILDVLVTYEAPVASLSTNLIPLLLKRYFHKDSNYSCQDTASQLLRLYLHSRDHSLFAHSLAEFKSHAGFEHFCQELHLYATKLLGQISQEVERISGKDMRYVLGDFEGIAITPFEKLRYFQWANDHLNSLNQLEPLLSTNFASPLLQETILNTQNTIKETITQLTLPKQSFIFKEIYGKLAKSFQHLNQPEIHDSATALTALMQQWDATQTDLEGNLAILQNATALTEQIFRHYVRYGNFAKYDVIAKAFTRLNEQFYNKEHALIIEFSPLSIPGLKELCVLSLTQELVAGHIPESRLYELLTNLHRLSQSMSDLSTVSQCEYLLEKRNDFFSNSHQNNVTFRTIHDGIPTFPKDDDLNQRFDKTEEHYYHTDYAIRKFSPKQPPLETQDLSEIDEILASQAEEEPSTESLENFGHLARMGDEATWTDSSALNNKTEELQTAFEAASLMQLEGAFSGESELPARVTEATLFDALENSPLTQAESEISISSATDSINAIEAENSDLLSDREIDDDTSILTSQTLASFSETQEEELPLISEYEEPIVSETTEYSVEEIELVEELEKAEEIENDQDQKVDESMFEEYCPSSTNESELPLSVEAPEMPISKNSEEERIAILPESAPISCEKPYNSADVSASPVSSTLSSAPLQPNWVERVSTEGTHSNSSLRTWAPSETAATRTWQQHIATQPSAIAAIVQRS